MAVPLNAEADAVPPPRLSDLDGVWVNQLYAEQVQALHAPREAARRYALGEDPSGMSYIQSLTLAGSYQGLRGERVVFGDHEVLWQGRQIPYWVSLQPESSTAEDESYKNLHIGDRLRFGFHWQNGRLKLHESYAEQGVIRYRDSPIQILRPVASAPAQRIPLAEIDPIVDPESCFASFRDGLLRVRWLGREAFVDHHGRLVIPPRMAFDEINDFVE
ncbi:MAG: hypothetical protein WCP34_12310, partial [Pseudomonadota bacterium]